ncbi:MAG: hypothetical protein L0Y32_03870 [Nevskiales bacterium]|nr:hypothetical protein [Nevskiales bacterium]
MYRNLVFSGMLLGVCAVLLPGCRGKAERSSDTSKAGHSELEQSCLGSGWQKITLQAAGIDRHLLWKAPAGPWRNGAILVLHGGGGAAEHFCAGPTPVQPQIQFAQMALDRGFAVFALDATTDIVTDSEGRTCGKRFDFSVLDRPNLDLPYIERIIADIVPSKRPRKSNASIFITGLSTGGYMTTRAGSELGDNVTAFAPVSAGDPFGTDTLCDTRLSKRTSAKGILVDRETRKQIIENDACTSDTASHESPWPAVRRPKVRQFHHERDGIVDLSCMRKTTDMLRRNGFNGPDPFLIPSNDPKSVAHHRWLDTYNEPLLDFFESQARAPAATR